MPYALSMVDAKFAHRKLLHPPCCLTLWVAELQQPLLCTVVGSYKETSAIQVEVEMTYNSDDS